MKLKFFCISIMFFFLANSIDAQRYAKKHFTCFAYNLEITDDVKSSLSSFDHLVQIKAEGKQSKIEACVIHNIYNTLTKILSDSLEVFFIAPNSFSDKVKYNLYGYPEMTIQKAIRLSDTKFFIRIDAKLENDLVDNDGSKYPLGTFKPQLKVVAEIYSKEGFNPIQIVEGNAEATKPISLSPSFITGLEFVDSSVKPNESSATLKSLINEATMEVLFAIKYTKPKKH